MPSDLKVTEDRFIQAMQLRIKQSNETVAELNKLQAALLVPGHVFVQSYIDDYNNLQDSINEANARTSAYNTALWEFQEALSALPGRSRREQQVNAQLEKLKNLDDAYEGNHRQTVRETLTFLLKELL